MAQAYKDPARERLRQRIESDKRIQAKRQAQKERRVEMEQRRKETDEFTKAKTQRRRDYLHKKAVERATKSTYKEPTAVAVQIEGKQYVAEPPTPKTNVAVTYEEMKAYQDSGLQTQPIKDTKGKQYLVAETGTTRYYVDTSVNPSKWNKSVEAANRPTDVNRGSKAFRDFDRQDLAYHDSLKQYSRETNIPYKTVRKLVEDKASGKITENRFQGLLNQAYYDANKQSLKAQKMAREGKQTHYDKVAAQPSRGQVMYEHTISNLVDTNQNVIRNPDGSVSIQRVHYTRPSAPQAVQSVSTTFDPEATMQEIRKSTNLIKSGKLSEVELLQEKGLLANNIYKINAYEGYDTMSGNNRFDEGKHQPLIERAYSALYSSKEPLYKVDRKYGTVDVTDKVKSEGIQYWGYQGSKVAWQELHSTKLPNRTANVLTVQDVTYYPMQELYTPKQFKEKGINVDFDMDMWGLARSGAMSFARADKTKNRGFGFIAGGGETYIDESGRTIALRYVKEVPDAFTLPIQIGEPGANIVRSFDRLDANVFAGINSATLAAQKNFESAFLASSPEQAQAILNIAGADVRPTNQPSQSNQRYRQPDSLAPRIDYGTVWLPTGTTKSPVDLSKNITPEQIIVSHTPDVKHGNVYQDILHYTYASGQSGGGGLGSWGLKGFGVSTAYAESNVPNRQGGLFSLDTANLNLVNAPYIKPVKEVHGAYLTKEKSKEIDAYYSALAANEQYAQKTNVGKVAQSDPLLNIRYESKSPLSVFNIFNMSIRGSPLYDDNKVNMAAIATYEKYGVLPSTLNEKEMYSYKKIGNTEYRRNTITGTIESRVGKSEWTVDVNPQVGGIEGFVHDLTRSGKESYSTLEDGKQTPLMEAYHGARVSIGDLVGGLFSISNIDKDKPRYPEPVGYTSGAFGKLFEGDIYGAGQAFTKHGAIPTAVNVGTEFLLFGPREAVRGVASTVHTAKAIRSGDSFRYAGFEFVKMKQVTGESANQWALSFMPERFSRPIVSRTESGLNVGKLPVAAFEDQLTPGLYSGKLGEAWPTVLQRHFERRDVRDYHTRAGSWLTPTALARIEATMVAAKSTRYWTEGGLASKQYGKTQSKEVGQGHPDTILAGISDKFANIFGMSLKQKGGKHLKAGGSYGGLGQIGPQNVFADESIRYIEVSPTTTERIDIGGLNVEAGLRTRTYGISNVPDIPGYTSADTMSVYQPIAGHDIDPHVTGKAKPHEAAAETAKEMNKRFRDAFVRDVLKQDAIANNPQLRKDVEKLYDTMQQYPGQTPYGTVEKTTKVGEGSITTIEPIFATPRMQARMASTARMILELKQRGDIPAVRLQPYVSPKGREVQIAENVHSPSKPISSVDLLWAGVKPSEIERLAERGNMFWDVEPYAGGGVIRSEKAATGTLGKYQGKLDFLTPESESDDYGLGYSLFGVKPSGGTLWASFDSKTGQFLGTMREWGRGNLRIWRGTEIDSAKRQLFGKMDSLKLSIHGENVARYDTDKITALAGKYFDEKVKGATVPVAYTKTVRVPKSAYTKELAKHQKGGRTVSDKKKQEIRNALAKKYYGKNVTGETVTGKYTKKVNVPLTEVNKIKSETLGQMQTTLQTDDHRHKDYFGVGTYTRYMAGEIGKDSRYSNVAEDARKSASMTLRLAAVEIDPIEYTVSRGSRRVEAGYSGKAKPIFGDSIGVSNPFEAAMLAYGESKAFEKQTGTANILGLGQISEDMKSEWFPEVMRGKHAGKSPTGKQQVRHGAYDEMSGLFEYNTSVPSMNVPRQKPQGLPAKQSEIIKPYDKLEVLDTGSFAPFSRKTIRADSSGTRQKVKVKTVEGKADTKLAKKIYDKRKNTTKYDLSVGGGYGRLGGNVLRGYGIMPVEGSYRVSTVSGYDSILSPAVSRLSGDYSTPSTSKKQIRYTGSPVSKDRGYNLSIFGNREKGSAYGGSPITTKGKSGSYSGTSMKEEYNILNAFGITTTRKTTYAPSSNKKQAGYGKGKPTKYDRRGDFGYGFGSYDISKATRKDYSGPSIFGYDISINPPTSFSPPTGTTGKPTTGKPTFGRTSTGGSTIKDKKSRRLVVPIIELDFKGNKDEDRLIEKRRKGWYSDLPVDSIFGAYRQKTPIKYEPTGAYKAAAKRDYIRSKKQRSTRRKATTKKSKGTKRKRKRF